MTQEKPPIYINFFKPSTAAIRAEVSIARCVLLFWFFLSYAIPGLTWLAGQGDPRGMGESFITHARFLGFPLHYWLLAQGCTLGYILLCKLYCELWDRKLRQQDKEAKR